MNFRRALAFAVGPVLSAALGFAALPLLAMHYSPEIIGRNNIFQVFSSLALLIAYCGLDQALAREFHETEDHRALFNVCFLPGLTFLSLFLLATLPFAAELSEILYGQAQPSWYYLSCACIYLAFITRFLSIIVRMQERGIAYSASQVFPKLVILLVLSGYVGLRAPHGYSSLLFANLAAGFAVFAVAAWNTRTELFFRSALSIDRGALAKALRFGLPLVGAGLAYWGLTASSTLALRFYSTFGELGVYSMAINFAGIALVIQTVFSTIWMPTVYKWVASNENLDMVHVVTSCVTATVCLAFCFCGAFSWVIDFIVPSEYYQVKFIVTCCMAQPLLYTVSEATVAGLNVKRLTGRALKIAVFAFFCNVLLSLALVPSLGASGAAVSNALAFFIFMVARTEVSARVWPIPSRHKIYLTTGCLTLVAVGMALVPRYAPYIYSSLWLIFLLIVLFYFRREFRLIWRFVVR